MKAAGKDARTIALELQDLQRDWTQMGQDDPVLWTYGHPKITLDQYFESGRNELASIVSRSPALGIEQIRGRALDFGCGIGRVTAALCNFHNEVHGLDISPSMIAKAKGLNGDSEKCHFHVHNSERLSLFEENYFDLVIAINILPFIPAVLSEGYLSEFIRVLKPGGLAYFLAVQGSFPRRLLPSALLSLYRKLRHGRHPLMFRADRFHLSERVVRAIVAEAGATVLHVDHLPSPTLWIECRYFVTKRETGRLKEG